MNEGKTFYTVTGLEFTYSVIGSRIVTSRTNSSISQKDFEKAAEASPSKPGDIAKTVHGSSYVFAILQAYHP